MDIEYGDILTEENLSSIRVANMDLIYWEVRASNSKKGWMGVSLYLQATSITLSHLNMV